MIIERLDIKSFGLITDMTLEFSSNVNVIEGQNEAGKSTIAAFIKYMLYGFDGVETDEVVSERKKRINWDTGRAEGSMIVKVKGKRYRITRSTTPTENIGRITYKEEASIVDLETGAPAFGKLAAGDVFFGVDRALFENTAFIGQVGDSGIDEGSVKESIENILFSGSEKINNQRAAARVADKMHALLHESGNGGAIVDLLSREQELTERLERCNEDNRRILEKENELHDIKQRRREAEARRDDFRDLDSCYSNVVLIQTFDQLHALEQELEEKNEAYSSFLESNTRAGFVPDGQYLTDLAVARKGVNESYHSLGDAQEAYSKQRSAVGITKEIEASIQLADEQGGEEKILSGAESYAKSRVRFAALAILSLLGVIAAGVFEIVAIGMPLFAWQIAIGCVGVVILALGAFCLVKLISAHKSLVSLERLFSTSSYADLVGKIKMISEARSKRDGILSATDAARLSTDAARERYENAKRDLTALILKWGEEPPTSELGAFLDKLEAKVKAFLDRKGELLDEKTGLEITVKEIRRNLADKSEIDVRAQVSPLKRKALAGMNHDEIVNGIADAKAAIAEEDRLAFDVENELSLLKGRAGDPAELCARIEAVAARRRALQEKHRAYFVALGAIKGASDNLRAEISPRLGEYATRMMEIMTDKKYSDFDVSEGLKVSFTAQDGQKKSVDFLSGGTRELAYVAVRAALIDMLYTEKPPVCFDESFAHQDNVRARSMMKAIKKLSEEGVQSFIFTCRGREAALATELLSGAGVFKLSVIEEEVV
ncbi:MAG: AAA family ATPase [Clostridia bacterium]|nr:AAA family ATPase [Clostridia bacterium]